ncbi:MAG: outer membrane lipid asymmetry maintenance protein MlaD [Rickettsiales bacterium]|nr:outer membrane lipid asymmetry maintenance protein MlaD [Rickettsiales bacterium]
MNKNYFETIIGIIIVVLTIVFFVSARNTAEVSVETDNSYVLSASFIRIDGIEIGSDVRIAGIKIGSVIDVSLDEETYEALIKISLANKFQIPEDSYISIISSGLIGSKYIDIEPGISEVYLQNNESFAFSRSSLTIEGLLNKFILKN